MEITARGFWTLVHGMGFGALYLLCGSGALVELYFFTAPSSRSETAANHERFLKIYFIVMVVLSWCTVLTGAYIIYPWYRAVLPPGAADLSMFPQRLLVSSPTTVGWHMLAMEWKEHIAWFAPISITTAAFVFINYGQDLKSHRQLRSGVLALTLISFIAAGIAGFSGAMINKYAPVHGGSLFHLRQIEK